MTWTLFEITPQRARETMRRLGVLTEAERAEQERIERAQRTPTPVIATPDDVKRARAEALARRLREAQQPSHYDNG